MSVDPNSLLIFKKRGYVNNKSSVADKGSGIGSAAPSSALATQAVQQKAAKAKKKGFLASLSGAFSKKSNAAQASSSQEEQVQSASHEIITTSESLPSTLVLQQPKPIQPQKEMQHAEQVQQPVPKEPEPVQEVPIPNVPPNVAPENAAREYYAPEINEKKSISITKNARQNMALAKGKSCSTHPWRPAYSICNYCKRPFCYSDLIEYNGAEYCLEDIDTVSRISPVQLKMKYNEFVYVSSVLSIIAGSILMYFSFSQFSFFASYVMKNGFQQFLFSNNYSYYTSGANLAIVALEFVSALLILRPSSKTFKFSAIVAVVAFVLLSYEYLYTYTSYLLATSILALINIGVMSLTRADVADTSEMFSQTKPSDIDWPRIETF